MTAHEKKLERDRVYYYANKENRLAYQRDYYKKNREKWRSYKSNPVSVGTVKAVMKMEECVRLLGEAALSVKSDEAVSVMRRCIDEIAETCRKLKNR